MSWMELASTYEPANADALSLYDQFRMFADDYRVLFIFIALIAVYYLGFATRIRMPILKTILLYVLLFAGSLIFGILDVTLPVKSALLVAIIILLIVKLRVKPERR
ncbi:YlaH-like family protein [Brevibacillus fulvus]|uniref:CHASE2 domain-containing sensor protein n=1 Tax=Brevibacillus fulvus TaxID=1125967 RepID=A0A938Y0F7_9BACL|nr:YlaH-like family protein [Brevibacillus fulvus]MBM7589287.1 CHASE2 domain-containing sensor protein [Brevibacillus fulvus]